MLSENVRFVVVVSRKNQHVFNADTSTRNFGLEEVKEIF